MKKSFLKRLTAIMLVAVMAVGMFGFAFAADSNTVTINPASKGHTYSAYQVFSGTVTESEGSNVLTGIQWGSGVNGAALLTAVKAIKLSDNTIPFSACADAEGVAEVLEGKTNDSEIVKEFAAVVFANKSSATGTSAAASESGTTITNLSDGYYLIVDNGQSATVTDDVKSSFMLEVLGNTTVEVKTELPKIDKAIVDGTDKKATDVAYGDTVTFKLTAKVASNVNDFNKYKLVFHDTMSAELDYASITSVTVDGSAIAANAYTVVEENGELTVTIADLLAVSGVTVTPETTVVVTYTAKVVEEKSGEVGTNTVKLEYSNDPTATGEGTTTETPDVEVKVYSYSIDVIKVDAQNNSTKLAGAVFVLKKAESNTTYYYDDDAVDSKWVTDVKDATKYTTGADGKVAIEGLDAGTYYLEEVEAPAGYNILENDVTVTINSSDEFNADTQFSYSTIVENNKGNVLPSTGGIGTTILFVVGGLLVVVAGVTLVVRKRMQNEAE